MRLNVQMVHSAREAPPASLSDDEENDAPVVNKPFVRPSTAPRKPLVPKASDVTPPPKRKDVDFIRTNALRAMHGDLVRPLSAMASGKRNSSRKDFGKVPSYLLKRQSEWAAVRAEEERLAGEPGCPPGTARMPAEEQERLLHALERSEADIAHELLSLPMGADTPKILHRRSLLEARLGQVQEAIAVFATGPVFVDVQPKTTASPSRKAMDVVHSVLEEA
jgi:hypothetical protein